MAKADIQLRGRSYSIACAPGQESRIEALSKQLDTRVKQIEGAVGDIGEERLLLITALGSLAGFGLLAAAGLPFAWVRDADRSAG